MRKPLCTTAIYQSSLYVPVAGGELKKSSIESGDRIFLIRDSSDIKLKENKTRQNKTSTSTIDFNINSGVIGVFSDRILVKTSCLPHQSCVINIKINTTYKVRSR